MNDKKIRALNLKYLHKDRPTDVLAFDLSMPQERGKLFSDVVISTDTALRNSRIYRTTPIYELYLYVTHATLHLLGLDDNTAVGRKAMDIKATSILEKCQYTRLRR